MTTSDFIGEIKERIIQEIKPWIESQVNELYSARIQRSTLSVEETANYIGISPSTLYIMVREGQIPTVKLGALSATKKQIRFRLSSLDRWLDQQEQDNSGD